MRVGIGYDVHQLGENRKLILGGVEISYPLGLKGHSDADVLVHAIMDALLGAIGEGDIGRHFPDTDNSYAGISSILLLKRVCRLLKERGYTVNNIDSIIIAEQPKVAPYISEMVYNVANALDINKEQVNIKATTTEKLGFVGRGEGIAAEAICSV
ncbi:MAG: 2-C-methyl-D-erythritol 2,4-cyclodiphosphate synthase, partial [Bacillota bacterium]|nr:2-C-methyl-D-erythritol 2,4-cyclodiphosphate synthase [Bacillota bacterium]